MLKASWKISFLIVTLFECHGLWGDEGSLDVSAWEHAPEDRPTRVREQQVEVPIQAEVLQREIKTQHVEVVLHCVPMGSGIQLDLGGGALKGSNVPTLRGNIAPASPMLTHT